MLYRAARRLCGSLHEAEDLVRDTFANVLARPGRARRTPKVGGLLGAEVARAYATKAANLMRTPAGRNAANRRRRLEAAEHIVDVLGEMKGPAMKLGQMASIVDLNGLPPDELEGFQAELGELRDRAPRASFKVDALG